MMSVSVEWYGVNWYNNSRINSRTHQLQLVCDQCLVYLILLTNITRYDAVYKPSLVNFKTLCEGLFVALYNPVNH